MELEISFSYSEILDMRTGKLTLYEALDNYAQDLLVDTYPEHDFNFYDIELNDLQFNDDHSEISLWYIATRNEVGR